MAKDANLNQNSMTSADELAKIEAGLREREQKLELREQQLREQQRKVKKEEKSRKQILLRLAPSLYDELARWADDDFRSVNGQIEYLLSEAVRRYKGKS